MKFIKLYEDFDWSFDEEEYHEEDLYRVGDILVARDNFYMGGNASQFLTKDNEYEIILIKKDRRNLKDGFDIVDDENDNHGFYFETMKKYFFI